MTFKAPGNQSWKSGLKELIKNRDFIFLSLICTKANFFLFPSGKLE